MNSFTIKRISQAHCPAIVILVLLISITKAQLLFWSSIEEELLSEIKLIPYSITPIHCFLLKHFLIENVLLLLLAPPEAHVHPWINSIKLNPKLLFLNIKLILLHVG